MISVLYVDDDPALLEIGKLFLEQSGLIHVDTAESADQGLNKLKSTTYDLVISDYQMPKMDGLAFLKIVRAQFPVLPFIIFTGKGREEIVIDALNCGADHYIRKGGDSRSQFTELIHTIKSSVEKKRALDTIFHLNRLNSVISRTNRAIIHIRDRQALLDEACKIAVEEGKFLMAWIGMITPGTNEVHPVAACGYEAGYLSLLSISTDNVPQGMGLTGSAIRECCPMVSNDIHSDPRMEKYREEASRRGYCSSAAFPLISGNAVVGAMRFYSNECNFFNDRELALLKELTDDISFALEMIDRDFALTELRRLSEALQSSNKKLNMLSNLIRHDILNTITGLLGLEDMAIQKISDPESSALIEKIKESTRRIQHQITFTRDYQNIGVHAPQWQNVHAVVSKAVKFVNLGSVRMSIIVDEEVEVYADAMLEKVFYNLIDNALRYGGKISLISFSLRQDSASLVITCCDDGYGITDSDKEKIFVSGFGKNTGQGLFLAREILGISGISIKEMGTFGKGSHFEITVPECGWRRRLVPT
jgi:signal transduction histidine kinase/DNA-binding NarL/FixJ family response regulator